MESRVLLMMLLCCSAEADTYHRGYMRHDGTYVQPHYQSAPNHSRLDNYSTQGNVNPYTGSSGTVSPMPSPIAPHPLPSIQPIQPLAPLAPLPQYPRY